MALGREGFHSYTAQIMDVTQIIAKGICTIPHLKLLGNTAYHVYVMIMFINYDAFQQHECPLQPYIER